MSKEVVEVTYKFIKTSFFQSYMGHNQPTKPPYGGSMESVIHTCPLAPSWNLRRLKILDRVGQPGDMVISGYASSHNNLPIDDGLLKTMPTHLVDLERILCMEVPIESPQKIVPNFHGEAELRYDGFLSDGDFKDVSEQGLIQYRYIGELCLVGRNHQFDERMLWMYYITAYFSDLPCFIFNQIQVRISPVKLR